MSSLVAPRYELPIADEKGRISREWYKYLVQMGQAAGPSTTANDDTSILISSSVAGVGAIAQDAWNTAKKPYPLTASEVTAGITPASYIYPAEDTRRYSGGSADAISVATVDGGSAVLGSPALPSDTAMNNGAAALLGIQKGFASAPTSVANPLVSVTKYFTGSGSTNYEGGCAWFSTYHEGGTQPSVGLTGYVKIDAGAAPCVGVHARGDNQAVSGAAVWASWHTAIDTNVTAVSAITASEHDLAFYATRARSATSPGATDATGLMIVNQSSTVGSNHGTRGLGIYSLITGPNESSWYTAIQIGGSNQNAVVAGNANEAVQLNGGTVAANAYAGIRTAGFLTIACDFAGKLTGAATTYGVKQSQVFQSDVTTLGGGYTTSLGTQATAFTMGNLRHFEANQGTIGAASAVTTQVGFYASASLAGGATNYGFYSNLNGASDWAFYGGGSAPSFFTAIHCPGGTAPIFTTTTTITNGAGAGAGTITNAPAAGNPTKWIPFNDAGTTRYFPSW